jgi:integral membrane sensor domain MASE1
MKAQTFANQLRVRMNIDRRYLVTVAVIAVSYVAAARLGLSFAYSTQQVTPVWPPSGISFVVLLVLGYRYWPGVLLGAFIANLTVAEPALVAAGIAVGNTLEAVAGAYILRRLANFKNVLRTPRDAGAFSLAALAGS